MTGYVEYRPDNPRLPAATNGPLLDSLFVSDGVEPLPAQWTPSAPPRTFPVPLQIPPPAP
jgi:hypothetical protein